MFEGIAALVLIAVVLVAVAVWKVYQWVRRRHTASNPGC